MLPDFSFQRFHRIRVGYVNFVDKNNIGQRYLSVIKEKKNEAIYRRNSLIKI